MSKHEPADFKMHEDQREYHLTSFLNSYPRYLFLRESPDKQMTFTKVHNMPFPLKNI